MKKLLSLILSIVCLLTFVSSAFAQDYLSESALRFREDGAFVIVNLCDLQDVYPMNKTTHQFVTEMLSKVQPDLVILGGDNCVASKETKADAIKEICDLFVNAKTKFTLVFGNHDHQQGVDNDTQFAMYRQYGGEYCLAYDAVPELTGTGTHNLPIMSSDGSRVAFNLYMFDSNSYAFDENGNEMGYDCVHPDQIRWYKDTAAALKSANGGKTVPAMAFQHIVVQEACDALFYPSASSLGKATNDFDGKVYTYLPRVGSIEDGYLFEFPCPGYYNYGQLDAMAETGDVIAVFSGHDHTNSYTVNVNGVNITNTPGCTYHSYGSTLNRGCRVIELNEKNPEEYNTYTLTVAQLALEEGSAIPQMGDITKTTAWFTVAFDKIFSVFFRFVKILFFYTGYQRG